MAKTSTKKYIYALGRRKSSIATVKLFNGKEESVVNSKSLEKYFPTGRHIQSVLKPFVVTDTVGKFYFEAKIVGGGKTGQSQSLQLAISRALDKKDSQAFHLLLKKENLLTVDSRVRQRRMIGTGGKSRRQKQSPKR